jgi:hypothetical protein
VGVRVRVRVEGTGERELMSEAVQQKKPSPIAARVTLAVTVAAQWFTASFSRVNPTGSTELKKKKAPRKGKWTSEHQKKSNGAATACVEGEEPGKAARERGVYEEKASSGGVCILNRA